MALDLTGRGSYEVDMEAMHAEAKLYLTKSEVNSLLLERPFRYAIEHKQIQIAGLVIDKTEQKEAEIELQAAYRQPIWN